MKKRKWLVCMMILCVLMLSVAPTLLADVGNSVDYGSGSSGGFESSYGGDSYSSSFDFYTVYFILRLLMDQPILLVIVLVIGGMFVVGRKRMGNIPTGHRTPQYETDYMRSTSASNGVVFMADTESLKQLVEKDPEFSEQMIVGKVNNMFMRLQLAWMNKKWEEVRPFETDALFNTHKMQLDQYIANHRTNKMDDICITNTELLKYYVQGEFEYLDVEIKARFADYVIDDQTGKVIKGDPKRTYHMQYKWKLMRKEGIRSMTRHVEATACPNCGANISINQAGRCEYCDSIVTKGDFDWVLSEIEVVSQR